MTDFLPFERPVLISVRHHWIVMFRLPHKFFVAAVAILLLISWLSTDWLAWLFVDLLVVIALGVLRWREWRAEWITLTRRRIIRTQGLPETTISEASLLLDRISGARFVETVPGKIFRYGTIELEAPGDHPDVRRLVKIAEPQRFYRELRELLFGEPGRPDPDDGRREFVTEPLPPAPRMSDDRDRFGRRRW